MFKLSYTLKNRIVVCLLTLLLTPFILVGQDIMSDQPILLMPSYSVTDGNQGLDALESQLRNDLLKINIPPRSWVMNSTYVDSEEVLDVAIIGGGMAGMTASFALIKEGISNIKMFDENPKNQEGPWIKYARMEALRSGKRYMGPALGIPSLTFWSWYEAQYGKEGWDNLKICPTKLWHAYLCWFKRVLKLPVENKMTLVKINPSNDLLELTFHYEEHSIIVYARKVILATGMEGSGGYEIPDYLKGIAKRFYAHTGEVIDPQFFYNKRIAIIGAGSSAFDAAGVALENGAESVDILVRRSAVSQINKFGQFAYPGLENGFYSLPDGMRSLFFAEVFKLGGIDPSKAALERIKDFKNLHLHYNTQVQHVVDNGDTAILQTNQETFQVDFIIAATGCRVDLSKRSELDSIRHAILLWENHVPCELLQQVPMLGYFPYLGPHFEFLEAEPGTAPFLKNIYCFNYGAFLSHGLLSSEIPGISVGATRLAKGIAADFFLNESLLYFEKIRNWQTPDFNSSDYSPLRKQSP